MKRSLTGWTTGLVATAFLGMPAIGTAQTPAPQQPPAIQQPAMPQTPTQRPAAATPQSETDQLSPEEHLHQAKAALDSIQPASVTGGGRTQLAELKRHLTALERASASPHAADAAQRRTAAGTNANWGTEVAAMDRILTDLLRTDAMTGTGGIAGTTGATGTRGTAGSKAATTVALDEATRGKLMEVRTHLTAYAAGMSGQSTTQPKPDSDDPSAAASAKDQTASAGTQPPSTTPSPASAEARPQADKEAARRSLTEARDTLSQLTQLPAAAQLTGEARAQVSQLIANFNELITNQTNWRAGYTKVAANLTALLGPDTADAAPTVDVPSVTPPAPVTPEPVGTAGAATATLDPAIRAKLVDLRRQLSEFERTVGGAEPDRK